MLVYSTEGQKACPKVLHTGMIWLRSEFTHGSGERPRVWRAGVSAVCCLMTVRVIDSLLL